MSPRLGTPQKAPPVATLMRLTARLCGSALVLGITAAPVDSHQQRPRFEVAVSRVRVDVIVTDKAGHIVRDLSAADFRVFEDGQRVDVLEVQLVDLRAGSVTGTPTLPPISGGVPGSNAAREATPEADRTEDPLGVPHESPAASGDAAASDLGAMVYLIDGPSLSPETKARFAEAWQRVLERTASTQVPKAVYVVDNVGRLRELAPLTRDASEILDAAAQVAALPLTTSRRASRLIELANDLNDNDRALARAAVQKAKVFEAEERAQSIATYRLLSGVCDALWSRGGRTALVWVSSGIKLMSGGPFDALIDANVDRPSWDAFSPDARILQEQRKLHRAANSANVSIYSVDPALISDTRNLSIDARVPRAGAATTLRNPYLVQSIDALDDALRLASDATGGEAFIRATDLETVFRRIDEHSSRFYLLTYEPLHAEGDGEYHEIRVEVDREDVEVRARRGYVDTPVGERRRRTVEAALQLPGVANDLPVEAEAYLSWTGDTAVVLFATSVDIAAAGVSLDQSGERISTLEFYTVVMRGDELVVQNQQAIAIGRTALETATLGPKRSAASRQEGLLFQHEEQLEPGWQEYDVRVAVLDRVSRRVGAVQFLLEVPLRPDGWHTSDIILASVGASGEIRPVIHGKVFQDQPVAVYVEVYRGQRPVLRGQVFNAGSLGDNAQKADLFPIPLSPAGRETHRGALPLPTGLPPGDYVLQVQVTDEPAEGHRVFRVPIQIVESSQ